MAEKASNRPGMRRVAWQVCAAVLAMSSVASATVIYSNDFSGAGANTDFPNETVAGTNPSWTVSSGVYTYNQSGPGSAGANATVNLGSAINNLTDIASFTITTQFTVKSLSGSGANTNTVGFMLFGDGGNPANYYHAQFVVRHDGVLNDVGLLSLYGVGTGSFNSTTIGDTGLQPWNSTIFNKQFTLVLEGTQTASALNLTLSLYDAAGTTKIGTSATATDTADILTGGYFGLRARDVMGGTGTFAFDNFTVTAVPEPATLAMLGLGGLMIGIRRRK